MAKYNTLALRASNVLTRVASLQPTQPHISPCQLYSRALPISRNQKLCQSQIHMAAISNTTFMHNYIWAMSNSKELKLWQSSYQSIPQTTKSWISFASDMLLKKIQRDPTIFIPPDSNLVNLRPAHPSPTPPQHSRRLLRRLFQSFGDFGMLHRTPQTCRRTMKLHFLHSDALLWL